MLHIILNVSLGSKTYFVKEKTPSLSYLRSRISSTKDVIRVSYDIIRSQYFVTYGMLSAGIEPVLRISMICCKKNVMEKRGVLISWLTVEV